MSIENVVDTLKQAKHETEKELAGINQALEYLAPKPSRSVGPRLVRTLSAAARRRISMAQKKRWMLVRKQKRAA